MKVKNMMKKIMLLGDNAVGKTSLVRRFVYDEFDDKYISTIGAKVTKKVVEIERRGILYRTTLMIWDVLGQKGFEKTHRKFLEGCDGALLVFDLTRTETFDNIWNYWIPLVEEVVGAGMIILGNKSDLEWAIDRERIREMAERYGLPYYITSAKTGYGVEDVFREITKISLFIGRVDLPPTEISVISSPKRALDYIMEEFISSYGDPTRASEIFEECVRSVGMNINDPSIEDIEKLIEMMYEKEISMGIDGEKAERNKLERMEVINSLKKFLGAEEYI